MGEAGQGCREEGGITFFIVVIHNIIFIILTVRKGTIQGH